MFSCRISCFDLKRKFYFYILLFLGGITRERAVQLLIESEKDYPSTWAAITAIAPKIGCTPETLRAWHQKHLDQQNPIKVQQISDQEKMRQMEREIKELKRANEILRKAAAFFAQAELDRPHK